jgi:hypothetical protein
VVRVADGNYSVETVNNVILRINLAGPLLGSAILTLVSTLESSWRLTTNPASI